MQIARQLDSPIIIRPGIVGFEPRMLAIKYGGRQHFITVRRIFVAQFADMVGDAKDFLHQHQPTTPFPGRLGVIDSDFGAIRHFHLDHFA